MQTHRMERSLLDQPAPAAPEVMQSPLPASPPPALAAAGPSPAPTSQSAPAPGAAAQPPTPAAVHITAVQTPAALQAAALSGARDIEVQRHLDLRGLARRPNPVRQAAALETLSDQELNFTLLYSDPRTRSLRVRPVRSARSPDAACPPLHALHRPAAFKRHMLQSAPPQHRGRCRAAEHLRLPGI